jgi:hypothetical protein
MIVVDRRDLRAAFLRWSLGLKALECAGWTGQMAIAALAGPCGLPGAECNFSSYGWIAAGLGRGTGAPVTQLGIMLV